MKEIPHEPSLVQLIEDHLFLLFGLLCLMRAVELLDVVPLVDLDRYGIHPRSASGLMGIVFAPLLHDGFGHLLINTIPFVVLGGIVLLGGDRVFWRVTVFVILLGGLGVWLFAGMFTNHLGASGLIFGYLGFVLARGFFERSLTWMLISVATVVLYGGFALRGAADPRRGFQAGTSVRISRWSRCGTTDVSKRENNAALTLHCCCRVHRPRYQAWSVARGACQIKAAQIARLVQNAAP